MIVAREAGGAPRTARFDPPARLHAAVFIPDLPLRTAEMRAALPGYVAHADAAHNVGRTALVVAALTADRLDLLGAMAEDRLHEPYRAAHFPQLPELIAAARSAGAQGASLSGAGSSVLALADERGAAERAAAAMSEAAQRLGLAGRAVVLRPAAQGARVVGRRADDLSRLDSSVCAQSTRRSVSYASGSTRARPRSSWRVTDYQTAGRGRLGREWVAPPGAALLLSAGFRPPRSRSRHAWRLAAIVALAMRDAAEEVAGLKDGTLWLKWPNDLVADADDGGIRKVAGVIGETVAAGDQVESAVVGIGINTQWRMHDFPWAIAPTMTSLFELSGKRPIDNELLLDAFLARLEPRYEALRGGVVRCRRLVGPAAHDGPDARRRGGWHSDQRHRRGVDPDSGALLLRDQAGDDHAIDSGEVIRCRVV